MPSLYSPEERIAQFWAKVDKSGNCWVWIAKSHTDSGYGIFWDGVRTIGAHRFSYKINVGPIPDGLMVLHRCDNPPCVRPDHLFLGTAGDNLRDAGAKGRLSEVRSRTSQGERNRNAKLTQAQVDEIRKRYSSGGVTQRVLALEYAMSRAMISNIITGRNWQSP